MSLSHDLLSSEFYSFTQQLSSIRNGPIAGSTGGYPVYRWNMAAACRLIALGAVIGATTAGLESTAQPHPCAWCRRIHETSPDRLEASTQWLRHPFGFGVCPLSADKAEAKR